MNKPTVGRVVHYVSHGTPIRQDGTQAHEPQDRAAIVTAVSDDPAVVSLAVLNSTGMFFDLAVPQDETTHAGGTWHWPERG